MVDSLLKIEKHLILQSKQNNNKVTFVLVIWSSLLPVK